VTLSISLSRDALGRARVAAARWTPREAGGLLFGWRTDYGVHIVDSVEVRARRRSRTSYERSERAAQNAVESYVRGLAEGSPIGYIGEWHSHPVRAAASPTDLATMARFSNDDGDALALVVLIAAAGGWDVSTWLIVPGQPAQCVECESWTTD
jgi:proteasome lid subunit RPN8/RPN11